MVPPQPDCGSSTWAPTTTTFNFRWGDGVLSEAPAINSGRDERPTRDLRLSFSIRHLLVTPVSDGLVNRPTPAIRMASPNPSLVHLQAIHNIAIGNRCQG